VHGTTHYNIHQLVRKFIFLFLFMVFIALAVGVWVIRTLDSNIENLENTESDLLAKNKIYSLKIEDKVKDISALTDKLDDIEEMMGFDNSKKEAVIKRADIAKITYAQRIHMLKHIPNGSPLKKTVVTANFGWREHHPVTGKRKFHKGIDLRAKRNTKIYATADGIVMATRKERQTGGLGNALIIVHNYGFKTYYGHLNKFLVKKGEYVKKGQLIALSGNTGRSTGPHLHYEVRYLGMPQNPKYFLRWNLKTYENIFKKVRKVNWDSILNMTKREIVQQKQIVMSTEIEKNIQNKLKAKKVLDIIRKK
jgi:murein DD-endopeptidase MepM/ murein hydrolase activator NlpD